MEKYIKAQDGSGKALEAFQKIKEYYTPAGKKTPSYPKVKAWFLKNYPMYGKENESNNQPKVEDVAAWRRPSRNKF